MGPADHSYAWKTAVSADDSVMKHYCFLASTAQPRVKPIEYHDGIVA